MSYLYSDLTEKIIGVAIAVHKQLGPGYPEKIYQRALSSELTKQKVPFRREEKFKVLYEGEDVGYEIMDFWGL